MKKAIGIILMAIMLSSFGLACLPTGFNIDKEVVVTGDWKFDPSEGWVKGNWATATFSSKIRSPQATEGAYGEEEKFGGAWKYDLSSEMQANAPTKALNLFQAWTVNDPQTTPATGGYTKFKYGQFTAGEFSSSSLLVTGFGQAIVGSEIKVTSPIYQSIEIDIN